MGPEITAISLGTYLAVFTGGILTSFTPCVYPLIPVTIGYIGGRGGGHKKGFLLSLVYVLGIAVTYSALGLFAALAGKAFGQLTSTPIVYFVAANLCFLFGLSMLGVFEIPVPGFLARLQGKKVGSGYISVFVAGLFFGLVAGPCTAPILGAILTYVGTQRSLVGGATLLFTFALGMGVLLIVVGTFSSLIAGMPQLGRWMGVVKKGFGVLMLAMGEYFSITMGKLLI